MEQQQQQQQSDQTPTMEKSPSLLEAFGGGELAALTGKEQLMVIKATDYMSVCYYVK